LKKDELFLYITLEEPYDGRLSRTVLGEARGEIPLAYSTLTVVFHTKKPPHKQHIWFLPTHKPTLKKPKELFFLPTLDRKMIN
jgi:hypothetical protein